MHQDGADYAVYTVRTKMVQAVKAMQYSAGLCSSMQYSAGCEGYTELPSTVQAVQLMGGGGLCRSVLFPVPSQFYERVK